MDSPSLRAEMGRKSRGRALQLYGWKNIIGLHEQLWKEQGEKANRQNIVAEFKRPYDMPAFYKNFSHYASDQVTAVTKIELSATGRQVADKQAPLFFYYDSFAGLSTPALHRILTYLQTAENQTFKTITSQPGSDATSENTGRHIMWLLKYGYLQITG